MLEDRARACTPDVSHQQTAFTGLRQAHDLLPA